MSNIIVRNARPSEANAIFELSGAVYHTTSKIEEHYFIPPISLMRHIQRFPEGVFVTEVDGQLAAYAITIRTHRSPDAKPLAWMDAIGGLELAAHNATGEWLYGVDFGVHPDFRKRGIGSLMYKARFAMVKQLNLRGFYAGGMLQGYKKHPHLSLQEYGERVKRGLIKDPTVTMQMNRGFKAVQVIRNYCGESTIHTSAMLISWQNPNYHNRTQQIISYKAHNVQA